MTQAWKWGLRLFYVSSFRCPPKWTEHIHNSTIDSHIHFLNYKWFISLVTWPEHDFGMETRLKLVCHIYVYSLALNVHQNPQNTHSTVSVLDKYHLYIFALFIPSFTSLDTWPGPLKLHFYMTDNCEAVLRGTLIHFNSNTLCRLLKL